MEDPSNDADARSTSALVRCLEVAPLALVGTDAGGLVVVAEGAALTALGVAPRAVGRPLDEVLPPALRPVASAASGERQDVAIGEEVWEVWCERAPDLGGVVVIAQDVTARRRAEEEAKDHLRFLDSVLEHVPDMIFVKDAEDLRFVRFNRAGELLLGYDRSELAGKNDYDLFPRKEADFFTSKDRAVLESGQLLDIPEERLHTRDGEVRILHTKKIPLRDERGKARYLLGISHDITASKAIEQQREELVQRLEELDQLKVRLIANVSHELRTPLTLVNGLTERVLSDPALPAAHRRDLDDVRHAARLLHGLVDDLLETARLEEGRPSVRYVEVDLARQTRLTVGAFDSMAAARGVRLAVEAPAVLRAQVDLDKFDRVLVNLLANALRFTPTDGQVRCTLALDGDEIVLTVADSGPGVPVDQREQVFERFTPAAKAGGGVGLGLSIVRDLAALHGGTITVGDAPEGGAAFTVRLPREAPAGERIHDSPVPADLPSTVRAVLPAVEGSPAPSVPSAPDGRPLVLVVDDNVQTNRFLVEILQDEYQVASAFDGEQGLELARQLAPDVVVTDLMMPRMGGEALLRALRQDPHLVYVPVLVLTARAGDSAVTMLGQGATDYVTKPFATEELRTRLRNAVSMKRARDVLQGELISREQNVVVLAARVAERTRDLEAALEAAVVAREQAERALRMRAEFLALIAHEVRTPIQVLRLGLDMLRRELGEGKVPSEVERVVRAGERLHRMVESMLEYASIESTRANIRPEPVDLRALVASVVASWQVRAHAKGLELALEPAGDLPTAVADPRLLRVVLSNLLDNAIKFTDEGAVRVGTTYEDGRFRIIVRDTGPGIPPEQQERIFDPFVHADSIWTKHHPGTGLGLALVRDIVTSLGGTITVDSTPSRGSAFVVTLPARFDQP